MPNFRHVMLDLETLSTRLDACILQIAAIAFDIETGELGPRLNLYVNESRMIGESVGHIDVQTVGWWMRQRVAAAMGAMITDEDEAVYLSEALGEFFAWFDSLTQDGEEGDPALPAVEDVCLWAHGATFDIPILQYAYEARCPEVCEGKAPWHYRAPRDTRTLFAVTPGGIPRPPKDETREHDAQYDCEYQIAQVVEAARRIRESYNEAFQGLERTAPMFADEQGGKHSHPEAAVGSLPLDFTALGTAG